MLDIPVELNAEEKDKLPYAVSSLMAQAVMENKTWQECLEQRVAFFLSDFDDLKALYHHELTRHLFEAEAGNLYGARISLDNLTDDLRSVHDRPSPAQGSVRSPARLTLVGGA